MRNCWCLFEFGVGNGYCVWIENAEIGTLELIYVIIVNVETVISRI